MSTEKTTDENIFRIRYKTFIPMLIAVVVTTNTATSIILNVGTNAEKIEYDKSRSDRKDDATEDRANAYTDIKFLELEVKDLKKELKDCKDGK